MQKVESYLSTQELNWATEKPGGMKTLASSHSVRITEEKGEALGDAEGRRSGGHVMQ